MYDLLLFDLDGTLCDPLVGISRSFNYALVHHGFEAVEPERVAEFIGPPLNIAFETILGSRAHGLVDQLIHTYRERYGEVGYSECHLYPNIADTLHELMSSSAPLAICTSKRADFAERILRRFELRELFQFVDGGDVGITKEQQLQRLRKEGRTSPRSIVIGDRASDLTGAHSNGMSSAAVLWGYGSLQELEGANPGHLFREPPELRILIGAPNPQVGRPGMSSPSG